MIINILVADHYDLKIGFFNHTTYNIIIAIIAKPWTKIQNLGQGAILAYVYFNILKYREQKTEEERKCRFPKLHHWHHSSFVSYTLLSVGCSIIGLNLAGKFNAFKDPGATSKAVNLFYYGTSRISYVFALSCLILNMFLGNTTPIKAMLSYRTNRLVSKSLAVGCVIQIMIIDVLYLS